MAATHNNGPEGPHDVQNDSIDIHPEAHDPTTSPVPASALRPAIFSADPSNIIRFRHPHYPDSNNILITLFAPDASAGGIEYGVAHAACGVISGNRWDGWFTKTTVAAVLDLTYGDILCERSYYFHLPESSLETPYAIVPTFKEWSFPHENLHPCWRTGPGPVPLFQSRYVTPSALSAAVLNRDETCRMSAYFEGTHTAHLCPRSEEDWFNRNDMSQYNLNPLLNGTKPTEDTANALLLRQDLHTHFDARKFVFVPKKIKGEGGVHLVTHLLLPSRELGIMHHNQRLKPIPDVCLAFLFARFAWSLFPQVAPFLKFGVGRTLIGTAISTNPGVPRILSAAECTEFISGRKSRNQSPTKRSRPSPSEASGNVDEGERQYKRQKGSDLTPVVSQETLHDTEEPEEITTPVYKEFDYTQARTWLKAERLRSDPQGTWLVEEAWARSILDNDTVMGPAESSRLYRYWGREIRDSLEEGE